MNYSREVKPVEPCAYPLPKAKQLRVLTTMLSEHQTASLFDNSQLQVIATSCDFCDFCKCRQPQNRKPGQMPAPSLRSPYIEKDAFEKGSRCYAQFDKGIGKRS